MKSADRDRDENAAVALALLQLATDVLEGRADVRLSIVNAMTGPAWVEYRTFENSDGVSVTAAKAIPMPEREWSVKADTQAVWEADE